LWLSSGRHEERKSLCQAESYRPCGAFSSRFGVRPGAPGGATDTLSVPSPWHYHGNGPAAHPAPPHAASRRRDDGHVTRPHARTPDPSIEVSPVAVAETAFAGRIPRGDDRVDAAGEQPRNLGRRLPPAATCRVARLDPHGPGLSLLPLHGSDGRVATSAVAAETQVEAAFGSSLAIVGDRSPAVLHGDFNGRRRRRPYRRCSRATGERPAEPAARRAGGAPLDRRRRRGCAGGPVPRGQTSPWRSCMGPAPRPPPRPSCSTIRTRSRSSTRAPRATPSS
jgi:hypothetical protein